MMPFKLVFENHRLFTRKNLCPATAQFFGDLIGKLDMLRVSCEKCGRDGRYQVQRLIDDRGRDCKIVDWLDQITADCPNKATVSWNDRCGARCPDLPRVL
jgi:hypothetical protein